MARYQGIADIQKAVADLAAAHAQAADSQGDKAPVDALTQVRGAAALHVAEMGWPDRTNEEWRKTPVAELGLDGLAFELALPAAGPAATAGAAAMVVPAWLSRPAGAFDEGVAEAVNAADLAASVRLDARGGLSAWSSESGPAAVGIYDLRTSRSLVDGTLLPAALEPRALSLLGKALAKADNRFVPWNAALATTALLIHIPQAHESKAPVVLDLEFPAAESLQSPLVLILAEAGSRAVIMQRLSGGSEGLVNHLVLAQVGPNAEVESHLVQNLAEDAVYVCHEWAGLGRDARWLQVGAQLGSGLAKTRAVADLDGTGAQAWLDGIYFAHNERKLDVRSVQNHNAPQAWSRAFYKGVVRDEARTVYQGLIRVAPDASKTDAYLTNRNMVLSDTARADSLPCLEILTNDVKCSHGSTTGKLPEDQLFYLQSRGFDIKAARAALVGSYLGEVLDRLPGLAVNHVRALAEELV